MGNIALLTIAATTVLLSLWSPEYAIAGVERQVCDGDADYPLGLEGLPMARRRPLYSPNGRRQSHPR